MLRNGADQKTPETKPVDMTDLMTGKTKPVTEKKVVAKEFLLVHPWRSRLFSMKLTRSPTASDG